MSIEGPMWRRSNLFVRLFSTINTKTLKEVCTLGKARCKEAMERSTMAPRHPSVDGDISLDPRPSNGLMIARKLQCSTFSMLVWSRLVVCRSLASWRMHPYLSTNYIDAWCDKSRRHKAQLNIEHCTRPGMAPVSQKLTTCHNIPLPVVA